MNRIIIQFEPNHHSVRTSRASERQENEARVGHKKHPGRKRAIARRDPMFVDTPSINLAVSSGMAGACLGAVVESIDNAEQIN